MAYDPIETLLRGEMTELPSQMAVYPFVPKAFFQQYFSKFGLYATQGLFDFPEDECLNKKFPEIETMKVREMLGLWAGK